MKTKQVNLNSKLVGELEGYIDAPHTVDYFSKQINRQRYMH